MKTKKTATKVTATKATSKHCLCGCKAQTSSRFAPGHDARIHSIVLSIIKGEGKVKDLPSNEALQAYLASAPWMTKAMKKAIGLEAHAA